MKWINRANCTTRNYDKSITDKMPKEPVSPQSLPYCHYRKETHKNIQSTGEGYENELAYQRNAGNNMGIPTAGYRSCSYNPNEWHEQTYTKYYQSFTARDNSEKARTKTDRVIKEADATLKRNQAISHKKMKERFHDVNFWKAELEKEWQDMVDETETLIGEKKRFENALMATEVIMLITTDNLNCRDRRYGIDKVEDEVELSLLKELDKIRKVQDLYKKTLQDIDQQIARNLKVKENVELDWSDKKEAKECDGIGVSLTNNSTNKQYYNGVSHFQEFQSIPQDWAQFSHNNIVRSENERMASQQLRTLIQNVVNDCSNDIRNHADIVECALGNTIKRMENAKEKLQETLIKTIKEIANQEKKIGELKDAMCMKDDMEKVAQTRLYARSFRPGIELCKDCPQHQLVEELVEVQQCSDALVNHLGDSERTLKDMMDTRLCLEKDIYTKNNSIFIDKEKCLAHRNRFPTMSKLRGYENL